MSAKPAGPGLTPGQTRFLAHVGTWSVWGVNPRHLPPPCTPRPPRAGPLGRASGAPATTGVASLLDSCSIGPPGLHPLAVSDLPDLALMSTPSLARVAT